MLGSLILYLKGMRIMMFQLSGFYCRVYRKSPCPPVEEDATRPLRSAFGLSRYGFRVEEGLSF